MTKKEQCPWIMYLRKSRADGDETVEQVLARHEGILQEHAVRVLGVPVPEEQIFREVVSGETIQDRPQMQKVLALIQSGSWAGVLVVDPQRLSRGDLMDCGIIIRSLQYSATALVTPSKTYDLADKYDRKFLEMELMRGADYLEYTKEILARGRLASVKAGYFASSKAPYGYDRVRDGKRYTLTPNADAETVQMIYQLFVAGDNAHAIALKLSNMGIPAACGDRWSQSSVRDILQNPVYMGKIRWNWKQTVKNYEDGQIVRHRPRNRTDCLIVEGRHPALVDEVTWAAAQARFGHVPRTKGWAQLRNPLATLLHCGTCGRAMNLRTYKRAGSDEERSAPRLLCSNQRWCHTKSATYAVVEAAVIAGLRQYIGDFTFALKRGHREPTSLQQSMADRLQKELDSMAVQQNKLYELLETGIYDKATFLARNQALAAKRSETQQALTAARKAIATRQDYTAVICRLQDAVDALTDPELPAGTKNRLLRQVVERIDYHCDAAPRQQNVPFTLDIKLRKDISAADPGQN